MTDIEDSLPITTLEIHTFGGLRIHLGGQPVAGLSARKAEALLVKISDTTGHEYSGRYSEIMGAIEGTIKHRPAQDD